MFTRATGETHDSHYGSTEGLIALVVATRAYSAPEVFSALIENGVSVVERGYPEGLELLRQLNPQLLIVAADPLRASDLQTIASMRAESDQFLLLVAPTRNGFASGLSAGADACLCDSDGHDVFVAQFSAIKRRSLRRPKENAANLVLSPGLMIDFRARSVQFRGDRIELTAMEWTVFGYLARRQGMVCSPSQILLVAADSNLVGSDAAARLKACVWRIRAKLRQAGANERIIRNVRSVGYMVDFAD